MKYRKLGASDLNVSEISLGSWLTYGVGVARDRAVACVDRAFELGINFIDTANVYGRGAAESFLGEVLALAAAQLLHPGDQGLFSHERHRQRLVAGADPEADRRLAAAAARRSCRSLSVPPLRQRDAARGDHGGPERGGAPGQGPLHRLQRMVGGSRSRRPSRSRAASISSPASRNIPCSGAAPKRRSSRFARPRASRRSSGRRWRRAC